MSRITKEQSLQLDSIRALSALVVLFGHTNQTLLLPTLKHGATVVGYFTQLSVVVFFVLSGFLIGKSVCNNISRNSFFDIGRYARDRALRLYPPLVAAVLLMTILYVAAPYFFPSGTNSFLSIPGARFVRSGFVAETEEILGSLVFLNGFWTSTPPTNGPLWSLSLEAWYYIAAAGIIVMPRQKILSILILLVTFLATYKNELFIMLSPIWFSGFGLAFLHHRHPRMHNRAFSSIFLASSLLVAYTVILVWNGGKISSVWDDPMNYFRLASGLWFTCFLAMIMGGAARFPTLFHSHASYSYTLYVTHFPIMLFALGISQEFIYGSITKSLAVSGLTIALSILLAMFISRFSENKELLISAANAAKSVATIK